ncbi:hypothetical protein ACJX0J_009398, partial [Zea mays]
MYEPIAKHHHNEYTTSTTVAALLESIEDFLVALHQQDRWLEAITSTSSIQLSSKEMCVYKLQFIVRTIIKGHQLSTEAGCGCNFGHRFTDLA